MNIFIRSSRDLRKKQATFRLITTALNPKLFEKEAYTKSITSKEWSLQAKPKEMVKAEPTNTRIAGVNTYHSSVFTLLLELNVICGQRWIQFEWQNSLTRAFVIDGRITLPLSKSVKSDHNWNFWYVQNNNIETKNIFSVRSSPDPPIFKKIAVRSSPYPAKIGFSPDPVRSIPDLCSSLLALYDAREFMPCSSLAFVWITETEHQVFLQTGYHVFLRHASGLYMHADLAICVQR